MTAGSEGVVAVTQADVTEADKAAVTRFHDIQIKRIMAGDRTLGEDGRQTIEQAFAERRLTGIAEGRRLAALAGSQIDDKHPAPRLIESRLDLGCGCLEEEWEAHGAYLSMHLRPDGGASDAHADYGDEGTVEMTTTAATPDIARAAILGWAAGLVSVSQAGDRK